VLQTLYLHSVLFELEVIRTPKAEEDNSTTVMDSKHKPTLPLLLDRRRGSQGTRSILLKGQMKYIHDIKAIVFLCSPL
jgi:guanylate cyclase